MQPKMLDIRDLINGGGGGMAAAEHWDFQTGSRCVFYSAIRS